MPDSAVSSRPPAPRVVLLIGALVGTIFVAFAYAAGAPVSPSLHTLLWHAHYYLAFFFFAVILGHIGAMIFHKLVRNDGIFETMAGGPRKSD